MAPPTNSLSSPSLPSLPPPPPTFNVTNANHKVDPNDSANHAIFNGNNTPNPAGSIVPAVQYNLTNHAISQPPTANEYVATTANHQAAGQNGFADHEISNSEPASNNCLMTGNTAPNQGTVPPNFHATTANHPVAQNGLINHTISYSPAANVLVPGNNAPNPSNLQPTHFSATAANFQVDQNHSANQAVSHSPDINVLLDGNNAPNLGIVPPTFNATTANYQAEQNDSKNYAISQLQATNVRAIGNPTFNAGTDNQQAGQNNVSNHVIVLSQGGNMLVAGNNGPNSRSAPPSFTALTANHQVSHMNSRSQATNDLVAGK
jgi:hypothetical protein